MKLCKLILIFVILFISNEGKAEESLPEIPVDIEEDFTRQLNDVELELFSKLLSPNDTTLQQGTKSLLAKYIIAQIIHDKRLGGSRTPKPTPAQTPAAIPDPVTVRTAAPVTEEWTTRRQATDAPVGEVINSGISGPAVRITPAPAHVLGQVDKILGNVATGNVIGIVDESLAIRAPAPVRSLVNGILRLVFCNPLDRIMNRCRSSNTPGANAGVGGGGFPAVPSAQAAGRPSRRPLFGVGR